MRSLRETWRERAMEWLCAAGQTAWGLIVIRAPESISRPYFQALTKISAGMGLPDVFWGWAAFLNGLILGLVVLFINGSWRRTPLLRQLGATFRLLVWACLLFGALSVGHASPSSAIAAMLFLMEANSIAFAAADGRAKQNGVR